MNVISYSDSDFAAQINRLLAPSSLFDPAIEQQTQCIIDAVRTDGDEALAALTERFNGPKLAPDQFAVTQAEWLAASVLADPALRRAIAETRKNVEAFARRSLRKDWSMRNSHGATVGEKFDALGRVGIYIPGGMAPLVSTALMTIPLARAAGCREIVVCTPCDRQGRINPALLYAARVSGATEMYRIGGAQAIAALALGTPAIPKVNKIFGPGNAWVVSAKRLLFGHAAIDLLPGPSELLVLADESADASCIAADLLAQAEHGSGHERVWLLTTSGKLLRAVQKEIARQLPKAARRDLITPVLERNSWLIQVSDLRQGIELANRLAPEHLEISAQNPQQWADQVRHAGAMFLGRFSSESLGDYCAGPNHVLPTSRTARFSSPLGVYDFQKRSSIIHVSQAGAQSLGKIAAELAYGEGLQAHARSAELRLK